MCPRNRGCSTVSTCGGTNPINQPTKQPLHRIVNSSEVHGREASVGAVCVAVTSNNRIAPAHCTPSTQALSAITCYSAHRTMNNGTCEYMVTRRTPFLLRSTVCVTRLLALSHPVVACLLGDVLVCCHDMPTTIALIRTGQVLAGAACLVLA